jgi:hypothetical protein
MDKRLKDEVLARIKDPTVREHYRAQLDMADELESDGVRTGGIFDVPGVADSGYVISPIDPTTRPRTKPGAPRFVPGLVAVVVAFVVAAILWWLR